MIIIFNQFKEGKYKYSANRDAYGNLLIALLNISKVKIQGDHDGVEDTRSCSDYWGSMSIQRYTKGRRVFLIYNLIFKVKALPQKLTTRHKHHDRP